MLRGGDEPRKSDRGARDMFVCLLKTQLNLVGKEARKSSGCERKIEDFRARQIVSESLQSFYVITQHI